MIADRLPRAGEIEHAGRYWRCSRSATLPSRHERVHDVRECCAASLQHLRLLELAQRVRDHGEADIGVTERHRDFLTELEKSIGDDGYCGNPGFFQLDRVMDTP